MSAKETNSILRKIRSRSYDDQNGVKRYVVEIFGDNMEMLSSPRQSQQAPQSAPAQPSGAQPVQQGSAAQSAPAGCRMTCRSNLIV